jgi:hypothetical protein
MLGVPVSHRRLATDDGPNLRLHDPAFTLNKRKHSTTPIPLHH